VSARVRGSFGVSNTDAQFNFEIVEYYSSFIDDSYSFQLKPFTIYVGGAQVTNYAFLKVVGGRVRLNAHRLH
jgi:hypothetical protein